MNKNKYESDSVTIQMVVKIVVAASDETRVETALYDLRQEFGDAMQFALKPKTDSEGRKFLEATIKLVYGHPLDGEIRDMYEMIVEAFLSEMQLTIPEMSPLGERAAVRGFNKEAARDGFELTVQKV